MSSKTASHMKWHVDGRMEGEMMRHPVDSLAWKNFDNTFFMLSLLIPGPTALGNDIDIYLQPLIDELNDLWDVKVAGPVQYQWMYPIEQYLRTLKSYVRNKSRPEEVSSFASAKDKNPIPGHVSYYGVLTDEMSHRRGRVQIVSPEDELDNLQQLSDIQPTATTTLSSSDPSDSLDPSVVGSISAITIPTEGTSSTSASSGASTSVSSTSVASTYVDEIYTQVMGLERHGRVRGYGFGPTPTSIFGSTSRR
ncbi:hypothetical protein CK203_058660 [Vitis vinifera]|uniref:Uncharacterized protein n=1 Tax=Vitis vinifera TaxID=29760 RepID=A0A438FTL2_VITVI|nr:hypothetical protein CK203_058660 [Vitis vinifera]